MAKARSRMTEALLQVVCIALLLALLIGILLFEASRHAQAWHGERVAMATKADTYRSLAYLAREELPVTSVDNGVVKYGAVSGESVPEGTTLATVYADGAGAGTRARAKDLQARIERIEAALGSEVPDYNGAYGAVMEALSRGELPAGAASQQTLLGALDKRDAFTDRAAFEAELSSLRAELDALIRNDANAFGTVEAAASGVFYREADGYESVITPTALVQGQGLTAAGLQALLRSPQNTGSTIGKLVCGSTRYLALIAPADAHGFTLGNTYPACFTGMGTTVSATLERLSAADSSGAVLLVFSFECEDAAFDLLRTAEVEIVRGEVSGLSLPLSAVYEEDGALVTYVAREGVATRCVLTPLYRENGCLLVHSGEGATDIRADDVVVLTVRRLYDGKVLK